MQKLTQTYAIPRLPPDADLMSARVFEALVSARAALAELKGITNLIPNPSILINSLSITEARASSEIENIITTHDLAFQASISPNEETDPAAKEVAAYQEALMIGFEEMKLKKGLLTNSIFIKMFQVLKNSNQGFRTTPGTALKNDQTGEIVYVPPQNAPDVQHHMDNLESFINFDDCRLDPLIKMAIIHHQFESIHPFFDGNGRIGRIVNTLYLVKSELIYLPILYLSRFITKNKSEYYRLLQLVREHGNWEEWLIYILNGVNQTSVQALKLIKDIAVLISEFKKTLKSKNSKIYSHELVNNIFRHPYTKIELVSKEVNVQRQTASKYLDILVDIGLLESVKFGRNRFFINRHLIDLLVK